MPAESAMTISTIIGFIGDMVTGMITWLGQVVTAVTSNPLILMFVIWGFIGTAVGVFKRLTR